MREEVARILLTFKTARFIVNLNEPVKSRYKHLHSPFDGFRVTVELFTSSSILIRKKFISM